MRWLWNFLMCVRKLSMKECGAHNYICMYVYGVNLCTLTLALFHVACCPNTYVCIYTYVYMHAKTAHNYVCVFVCAHICMNTHTHVHIHTQRATFLPLTRGQKRQSCSSVKRATCCCDLVNFSVRHRDGKRRDT